MKIKEITICLHCGCNMKVVNDQMDALEGLNDYYKVYWNNRIDRHPGSYDSFSELINHSIVTSPTEYMLFLNDRVKPTFFDAKHILQLLENGFAMATKYSVGFMGFSKQLIRKIGWWDEGYFGGGFEDDDFVLRLRLANLAYYESEEAEYDQSWKSPLFPKGAEACKYSGVWFRHKWKVTSSEVKRMVCEEPYFKYDGKIGDHVPAIEANWKDWSHSQLGIMFKERIKSSKGGPSRTRLFMKDDYKTEYRKVTSI
jgi:hypothetical protein